MAVILLLLREALALNGKERLIGIIGGGGKTTLLYRLADEFAASGGRVLLTTTTKMCRPAAHQADQFLVTADDKKILLEFCRGYNRRSNQFSAGQDRSGNGRDGAGERIFLAKELLPENKVQGIEPILVSELALNDSFNVILVEADGAARRSAKGYAPHEPNIPAVSDVVIVVTGLDLLGGELTSRWVHRAALAAQQIWRPEGSYLDEEAMAKLNGLGAQMARKQAFQARRVAFLNKADTLEKVEKGVDIARHLLDSGLVERVLVGSCISAEPVVALLQ